MIDPKTEAGFREQIKQQRYTIVRQSVFNLAALEPIHDEWLVRFDAIDNLAGILRPAEISGAIADLDIAMLRQAIYTLNLDKRRLPIAVNISGVSMIAPQFCAQMQQALSEYRSSSNRLIFELTESWDIRELEAAQTLLDYLSDLGHPLCLDDVGAGAASIRYLRAFKTDWLKIDGDFVKAAAESERELAILRALLSLREPLGVKFIAEGIETSDLLDFAKSEGFEAGQGYALARPEREPLRKIV